MVFCNLIDWNVRCVFGNWEWNQHGFPRARFPRAKTWPRKCLEKKKTWEKIFLVFSPPKKVSLLLLAFGKWSQLVHWMSVDVVDQWASRNLVGILVVKWGTRSPSWYSRYERILFSPTDGLVSQQIIRYVERLTEHVRTIVCGKSNGTLPFGH